MRRLLVLTLLLSVLPLLLAPAAQAGLSGQTKFKAVMSGEQEVPPVDTDARGIARFRARGDDDKVRSIRFRVVVHDIDDVIAAHIHCGRRGVNGPIGVTLFEGGPVSPDGELAAGKITEPDADNDCDWEKLRQVLRAMRRDKAYANVHTLEFPGGEIRGQIE